jgi:hypothetical protein
LPLPFSSLPAKAALPSRCIIFSAVFATNSNLIL